VTILPTKIPTGVPLKQTQLWDSEEKKDGDPLLADAIDIVRREGRASVSMLQRRLRIGYTRSARPRRPDGRERHRRSPEVLRKFVRCWITVRPRRPKTTALNNLI